MMYRTIREKDMAHKVKQWLIGKPLKNESLDEQRLGVTWGLPILASDAISSVAYAGQQILMVLLPAIGLLAYAYLGYLTIAVVALMALLVLSYFQTIDNYPNGGGAYIVAKDNLGVIPGVVAGAALSVGYILTVAVSVAAGVDQITSVFLWLRPYTVLICVLLVLFIMMGNLRGIRESARIFGVPTYLFIAGMLAMVVLGLFKLPGIDVATLPKVEPTVRNTLQPALIILVLSAFSSGCSALTGVEAVSNAVPSFRNPSQRYAKLVLALLAAISAVLLGGTAYLCSGFHIVVNEDSQAVIIQLARSVFGEGFMLYYIMFTTFLILVLAANTAYSGFPLLVSIMAKEGFAPKQLSMRGDRLSYSNGILALSLAAIVLLIVFRARVDGLIGLYAIGVFISFTLSQGGMFARWIRHKGHHWGRKAAINGTGALGTTLVVVIISIFKFEQGAWIVVILIPIMAIAMLRVKRHYLSVARQLRLSPEELSTINIAHDHYRNRVIVPIETINRASIRALRYARTISDNVIAFSVAIDEVSEAKLRARWNMLNTDIPYFIRYSPYRKVVEPLLEFIRSAEYDYQKNDMITVILPQFELKSLWNKMMHNRTRYYIERELLRRHKHIVVAVMPFQLKPDDAIDIKPEDYRR